MSPATDVYAAATMLYELLGGALPFPDDGEAEDLAVLFKHAYEKPVPLREVAPGVPDPVAAAVMRALATEPADRFESAESFGAALAGAGAQAWARDGWRPSRSPSWTRGPSSPRPDAGPRPRARTGPPSCLPGLRSPSRPRRPGRGPHPARPAADRRRRLIIVAVIAVLVIAVVAVLVFGHVFTVYGSGSG